MTKMGLTAEERKNVIFSLEKEDYKAGPLRDHSYPKDHIWEFGKKYVGNQLYIKLNVFNTVSGLRRASCISFHDTRCDSCDEANQCQ